MRIVRLKVAGFGPYRAEQTIHLAPFDEAGIFLITGRTGAGKSTILDAVCFALYGSVPRFEGRDLGVRSQHCRPDEETFAELDFAVRGTTYRIRQSPKYERPSRRGGLTTQAATVSLAVQEGGAWRTLATKATEVAALLQEVLPLKRDQFLQVVLLAQGRFQEFLLAPTDKRRQVLRTLFRTERFETLEEALQERRRALEERAAESARRLAEHAATVAGQCGLEEPIEPDLDWFETAWVGLEDRVDGAESVTAASTAALARAEAALGAQETLRKAQARRDEAVQRLAALAVEEPAVLALRTALDRAELAERVRPLLDRRDSALRECTAREAAAGTAEAAWSALGAEGNAAEVADGLLTALGALEPALAAEQELARRRTDAERVRGALARATAALADLEARAGALPAALDELEPRLAAVSLVAASREDRDHRVRELEQVLAAARRAAALGEEAAAAAAKQKAASTGASRAAAAYDDLIRRRLAGAAAELAVALVPGEPCAVCGSTDHPSPASSAERPVSDGDLDAAKAVVDATRAAADRAGEAVAALARSVEAARAAAAGRAPADAEADLDDARSRATQAASAAADAAALEAQRGDLRADLVSVQEAIGTKRDERDGLAATAAAVDAALGEAERGVEAARQGFPTVAARRDRLRAERAAAHAVVRAREALQVAARAAGDAVAALELQIAAVGFADEAAVVAALLPSGERAAGVRRVREHDDSLARARGTLAEPELQGLPAEPADPSAAREAVDAARTARDEALAAEATARDRLASITARLTEVRRLLGSGSTVREEHRLVRELAEAVSGRGSNTMRLRLETYVLAAHLEDVLAAANGRLAAMTGRRYSLVLDDGRQHRNTETGLGVTVLDAHTGDVRQAASLSGGETFLASLALALGLAEVVSAQAGGVTLDTLFVDEGFGSLDAETLDVALAALEALRAGGRTIGLISHVESMRERIPAKLAVTVLPGGESAVEPAPALV